MSLREDGESTIEEGDLEVDELVNRATDVVHRLAAKPRDRPLFVEFAGTPKSGKSSCIGTVAHFFRRMEYRVLAPTEGASKRTPPFLKDDLLAYNTWSACYALTQIWEARYHSDRYHIALLDRGLFDALVWFQLLHSEGTIGRLERQAVQDFLMLPKWRDLIDLVFLFTVDPDEAMRREGEGTLVHRREGRAMNPIFLSKLNSAYETVKEEHAEQFTLFQCIDTSTASGGLTLREAAIQSIDLILGVLEDEQ